MEFDIIDKRRVLETMRAASKGGEPLISAVMRTEPENAALREWAYKQIVCRIRKGFQGDRHEAADVLHDLCALRPRQEIHSAIMAAITEHEAEEAS